MALVREYDAIVIGAGHNGLVCANYLARSGLKVAVLEQRKVIGGAAVTEEFAPGFRASIFSYMMSLLHPRVIRDFELMSKYGLKLLQSSDMISPLGGDDYILFSDDVQKTVASFAKFNKHDADIYPLFDKYLVEATKIVRQLLWETPFDPARGDWKSIRASLSFLWRYRKVGRKMYRLIDLLTMSAYDFLKEWFEDERIIAVLAYYASIGHFLGPKSPGSAYVIMHHVMGEHEGAGGWGFVEGGMGKITQALAAYGRDHGVEIFTDAAIAEIGIEGNRATSVVTRDGAVYKAKTIVSNANAKILYQNLIRPGLVPDELKREIDNYRTFSTAFKMNVACERPPQFTFLEKMRADKVLGNFDYPTYMHVAPDVDYLEKAYDDAKYGWYSTRPFVSPICPTILDKTLAPEGKHVVNLYGGHAPYELKGGNWATEKDNFKKNIFDTIEEFAPGWTSDIIDLQFLVPPDIEEKLMMPQGHIFHGELTPDQLFFQRPASGYADYRTPFAGLYTCGSSNHPGGGVSGIPGSNAAREILLDLKRG